MSRESLDGRANGGFTGEAVRSRRIPGFIITQLRHNRALKSGWHAHRLAYFSFLTGGTYVEREPRGETAYGVGDVRFHPEGFSHADEIGPGGARFLCLEFDAGARALPMAVPTFADPRFWPRSGEAPPLAAAIARELRNGDPGTDLVLEGLALQLVGALARLPVEERMPRWLARVEERLRNGDAGGVRISDLAAEAGVHPVHLARAYRKHFHRTIGETLRQRRIERVRRSLAAGEALAAASDAAGFADQSHMSRVFRRVTGTSPGEYRRSLRVPPGPKC